MSPSSAAPEPGTPDQPHPNSVEIEFDLQKLLDTASIGYRRAAVFMGLGCNAARREDLVDYRLDHATKFHLLPETVSPEVLKHWKEEFYQWVVGGGFREIVDHTNVFLDQVYDAVSILIDHKRDTKRLTKFRRGGLTDKIAALKSRYGISCRYPDAFGSVGPVRNCLVHRLGVVGPEDVGSAGTLSLAWFGLKMIFKGNDGTEYGGPDITNPNASPWTAPCEGMIAVKFMMFEEKYALGQKIVLTPAILHQVIWSMQLMAGDYVKAITERAGKEGALKE